MKRMFLPVGQGAFYCERFMDSEGKQTKNFVYDCGVLLKDFGTASGKLKWLENIIDEVFAKGETIEAVFISHLHEDHISGLKHLAKRCKIKRIYLPYIDEETHQLILLDYEARRCMAGNSKLVDAHMPDGGEKFVEDVLKSEDLERELERLLDPDVEIVRVKESETANEVEVEVPILGGDHVNHAFWKYKFFCINDDDTAKKIKDDLLKLVKDALGESRQAITADVVSKLLQSDGLISKICKIYKRHMGSERFNVNSLVVYSGCDNIKRHCCRCSPPLELFCCTKLLARERLYNQLPSNNAVGCLYTGDFNAQDRKCWDKLKCSFKNEWANIGCFQIPHHGSSRSYNDQFLDEKVYHVISAGLGNKYCHPSLTVLEKYRAKGGCPIIVTQNPQSFTCFNIWTDPMEEL